VKIEVLGMGCPRCEQTKKNIYHVLAGLGLAADVSEVKDLKAISAYGVLATPAVAIDGVVKCTGRIPNVDEIKKWFDTK
jgi:small redox-active disulfide protein 2